MKARAHALRYSLLAFATVALIAGHAEASNNKIALIPGGPHPYFAPWEQAAAAHRACETRHVRGKIVLEIRKEAE